MQKLPAIHIVTNEIHTLVEAVAPDVDYLLSSLGNIETLRVIIPATGNRQSGWSLEVVSITEDGMYFFFEGIQVRHIIIKFYKNKVKWIVSIEVLCVLSYVNLW